MPIPKLNFLTIMVFVFSIGFCNSLASNENKGDSLVSIARDTQQTLNHRITAYKDLVFYYEVSNPKKAIQLGNEGLVLPQVDSLNDLLGMLYSNMAFVHFTAQEYEDAIPYFESAASLFEQAGELQMARKQYSNIGVLYRKLGNYAESIKYQVIGLKKSEQIGDLDGQINTLINIGNIYVFQKQPELAFPYYKKAYHLSFSHEDSLLKADAKNSYAVGFDHLDQKDSALYYYKQAIEDFTRLKQWVDKAKTEHNVALIYLGKEDYVKAEALLLSSWEVFEKAPTAMDIEKATIQSGLARVYANSNRQDLAIRNFKEALTVFRKRGAKTEEKSTLQYLSQSFEQQGNFQKAYEYQREFMIMKDSIQNNEITTEIASLTEQYESEKKEKEILRLQNKSEKEARFRWFVISVSLGVISLLIIVLIIYRHRKVLEAEKFQSLLQQKGRELDILRHKIAHETALPHELTINRGEVNTLIKEELSERELDVFMLLLEGHTNRAIAEKLFVSKSTIKFHLQNIYVKLDVDNRTDAILSLNNNNVAEPVMELSDL